MGDLPGLTLEELVAGLRERGARMPFEIGAFVALQVCEQLLDGPAVARPADVRIAEDGSVSAHVSPNSATGADAARSVAQVLAHVLVAAGQGVPPILLDLVEQGPGDGRWDLPRLRDELEASLVPLNRSAARRVLSRLVREARRPAPDAARPSGAAAMDADGDLDAEVDALLSSPGATLAEAGAEPSGDEAPSGEPQSAAPVSAPQPPDRSPEPARASVGQPSAAPPPPESEPPSAPPPAPWAEPAVPDAAGPEAAGPGLRAPDPRRRPDLAGFDDAATGSSRYGWLFAAGLLALLGVLVAAVAVVRPDVIDRILGRPVSEDPTVRVREEARQQVQRELLEEQGRKFGTLTVRASPARAQVLLFVGRGPAEARDLPVGVAHEFVTVADGKRPTRAVVPKDAAWTEGPEGLRYELAMQTGDEAMAFEDLAVGETRLPQDVGTPAGKLGTVRVVTNPPGAKIYQLIGFGAHVEVDNLRTDRGQEVLVVHDGHEPVRKILGPSDWREAPNGPELNVEVALDERQEPPR